MNRDELLRVATAIHVERSRRHRGAASAEETVDVAASLIAEVDKRCGEECSIGLEPQNVVGVTPTTARAIIRSSPLYAAAKRVVKLNCSGGIHGFGQLADALATLEGGK